MIRALALAAALVCACGKSDAPAPADKPAAGVPVPSLPAAAKAALDPGAAATCEASRDKYLAWSAARVKSALDSVPSDQRAAMQAEADKEAAQARDRFVEACVALGSSFDADCFEHQGFDRDRTHRKHCDEVWHALEAKIFGH